MSVKPELEPDCGRLAGTARDRGSEFRTQTGHALRFDPGPLSFGTTYFWHIDAKNSSGTTPGEVWRFGTNAFEGVF